VICTCCADALQREVARFERELHCGVSLLDEGLDCLGWQLSNRTAITTDRKQSVVATEPDQRRTMARMHVRDDAAVRQHPDGAVHRRLVDGGLFDMREPCQLGRIDRATVSEKRPHNGNAWGGCSAAMGSQDRFGIVDRPAVDERCLFFVQPHWERAID
jgi:hypothetical protein